MRPHSYSSPAGKEGEIRSQPTFSNITAVPRNKEGSLPTPPPPPTVNSTGQCPSRCCSPRRRRLQRPPDTCLPRAGEPCRQTLADRLRIGDHRNVLQRGDVLVVDVEEHQHLHPVGVLHIHPDRVHVGLVARALFRKASGRRELTHTASTISWVTSTTPPCLL